LAVQSGIAAKALPLGSGGGITAPPIPLHFGVGIAEGEASSSDPAAKQIAINSMTNAGKLDLSQIGLDE
jgi:hypothetical protein